MNWKNSKAALIQPLQRKGSSSDHLSSDWNLAAKIQRHFKSIKSVQSSSVTLECINRTIVYSLWSLECHLLYFWVALIWSFTVNVFMRHGKAWLGFPESMIKRQICYHSNVWMWLACWKQQWPKELTIVLGDICWQFNDLIKLCSGFLGLVFYFQCDICTVWKSRGILASCSLV